MNREKRSLSKVIVLIGFLLFLFNLVSAQMEPSIDPNTINNDSRREEIQRYFGYEDLFFRYTTLPYDISQNTNENAVFLDVGFLFILFLPLILIFKGLRRRLSKVVGMIGLFLYLCCCFYFSRIMSSDGLKFWNRQNILEGGQIEVGSGFIGNFILSLYSSIVPIVDYVLTQNKWVKSLDNITYPIVLLAFLLAVYLALRIERRSLRNIAIIYLCFSLLFFILSAGIVWYGFLMIPLSFYLVFYIVENSSSNLFDSFLRYSFYSMIGLWVMLAVVLRISNIQHNDPANDKGKNLFFSNVLSYSIGKITEEESLEAVFPNVNSGLNEINNSQELVYRIGTSLSIHIKKNSTRVYNDSQLAMFHSLYTRFGGEKLFSLLKEYGFGYLIIDLHTPSIDRTPDQSLTKKYQLLLETVYNNPNLYLVATDRKLKSKSSNGQDVIISGIFGQPYSYGNYAIFKII
jgi:hypothetical protein